MNEIMFSKEECLHDISALETESGFVKGHRFFSMSLLICKNDVNFAIKDLNYCTKIDTIIIGMNWFNFKQNRKWRAENE